MKKSLAMFFKRINQVILVFPVWIVVGLSGFFKTFDQVGWLQSKDEENYGRMF